MLAVAVAARAVMWVTRSGVVIGLAGLWLGLLSVLGWERRGWRTRLATCVVAAVATGVLWNLTRSDDLVNIVGTGAGLLQDGHVAIEIDPVQTLHIQHDVTIKKIVNRHRHLHDATRVPQDHQ